jgi:hypothetical protein
MVPVSDQSRARAELEAVLSSECFARATTLRRLLEYIGTRGLEGTGEAITEYDLGVHGLGRTPTFDPQSDSSVRVSVYNLRKRLEQYYRNEGAGHELRIVVPVGSYAPHFLAPSPPAADVEDPEPAPANPLDVPASPRKRWIARQWVFIASTLSVLAAVLVAGLLTQVQPPGKGSAAAARGTAVLPGQPFRMAAGAARPYVDHTGVTWEAERYARGGSLFHLPARGIVRTADADLYLSGREGDFEYAIPLPPGTYEVHLHFAETRVPNETMREMQVLVNGRSALALDIVADAGGPGIATIKVLKDVSPGPDGRLHLSFRTKVLAAFVNAIEVLPGLPGRMLPVRITTRDSAYADEDGRIWLPDRYYQGGQSTLHKYLVKAPEKAGLYNTERYGHFSYAIPVVDGGKYRLNLYFSEAWFGEAPTTVPASGYRVFDVYSNGITLLSQFDILREVGRSATPLVKSFRHVAASPQGKLDLTFVPRQNLALINAIEVLDEAGE